MTAMNSDKSNKNETNSMNVSSSSSSQEKASASIANLTNSQSTNLSSSIPNITLKYSLNPSVILRNDEISKSSPTPSKKIKLEKVIYFYFYHFYCEPHSVLSDLSIAVQFFTFAILLQYNYLLKIILLYFNIFNLVSDTFNFIISE